MRQRPARKPCALIQAAPPIRRAFYRPRLVVAFYPARCSRSAGRSTTMSGKQTARTPTTPFGTDLYRLQDGRKVSELSLPDRLRAMASLMHAGSAWGFCGEATWLEEAADKL